jgi:hypothetical protein
MTVSAMPGTGSKIDMLASIEHAYGGVLRNWQIFVELAWLPFVIVVLTQLIGLLIGGDGQLGNILADLVRAFGFLVFGTIFVVRWHRFVLLGESGSHEMFSAAWRHFFFAGLKLTVAVVVAWAVLFYLAMLPPRFLMVILFPVIGGIGLVVGSVRVSLVFPAAAIDKPLTFRAAWDLLAGNTWRYFLCAAGCYLPFALVAAGLGMVGHGAASVVWFSCQLLGLAISFVGIGILAGVASEVYRAIVGDHPGRTAAAA